MIVYSFIGLAMIIKTFETLLIVYVDYSYYLFFKINVFMDFIQFNDTTIHAINIFHINNLLRFKN
jgi:hypothetical protein